MTLERGLVLMDQWTEYLVSPGDEPQMERTDPLLL